MKKKIGIAFLQTCMLSIVLTGCWDMHPIDEVSFVNAVAIDKGEGDGEKKVQLSIQILKVVPSGGNQSSSNADHPVVILSQSGKTIYDAFRNIADQSSRVIKFQQNRVLIIGDELAKEEGLLQFIDFFTRRVDTRGKVKVIICKGKASKILQQKGVLEDVPADELQHTLDNRIELSGKAVNVNFHQVLKNISSKTTTSLLMPVIASDPERLKFKGTAVFKEDKMIGVLNSRETQGAIMVNNDVQDINLFVPLPEEKNKEAALIIRQLGTKIKTEIIEDKIKFSLYVKADTDVSELNASVPLHEPKYVTSLEKNANAEIKKMIESALSAAQNKYHADIFGFGEEVHRKYPRRWKQMKKNWNELFQTAEVNVEVTAKIRVLGMIEDSLTTEEEGVE